MGSIQNYSVKASAPPKVLVIGGSYGGFSAGLNLFDLCNGKDGRCSRGLETPEEPRRKIPVEIKFVDERDGYYHLIGSPLALADPKYAEKAWIRYEDLPALKAPELSWTQGSVVKVDMENKVALIKDSKTGKDYEEAYDYLIAASGLRRQWPAAPQSLTREGYLAEVGNHIEAVKAAKEGVVVIGGGAVGIEMAAELKLIEPAQKVTLIHSRDKLLSSEPLPDEFKDKSFELLKEAGVEVIMGKRVKETVPIPTEDRSPLFDLTLSDDSHIKTSNVTFAISQSSPTTSYLPKETVNEAGYVKINSALNFQSTTPNHLQHYAIGDIVAWSGIKRCGGAMAMGFNAATNIHRQLLQSYTGKEPKFVEWPEVPPVMGLAVGKKAVCFGGPDGVVSGEDQMALMFGDDLGFSICYNWLRLGVDGREIPEQVIKEKSKEIEVEVAVIETMSRLEEVTV